MELNGKARERIRAEVRAALSRDDMTEADIADMAADMTMAALHEQARERKANMAARFLPASGADDDTLPMIEVARAQVYAYVQEGILRVSVDLDQAGVADYWNVPEEIGECVPVQIDVGVDTVWAADRKGRVITPMPEREADLVKAARAVVDGWERNLTEPVNELASALGAYDDEPVLRALPAEGEVLLCDPCYEAGTDDVAVCQDHCTLDLDHAGECGDKAKLAWGSLLKDKCDRCGKVDRLTRIDVVNLDFGPEPFDPYMGDKHRYYHEN